MAVLALAVAFPGMLGAAGVAAGSAAAIGAQIGFGLAAAYIDARVVMPALFPPPDIKGPRLNGFKFGTSDEGAEMVTSYGSEIRVPCQVIDVSEFTEFQNSTSQNGKGGQGGNLLEYTYKRHVLVSVGRGGSGPIARVKKIWFNERVVYNEDPDLDVSSTLITGLATTVHNGGASNPYYFYLRLTSTDDDADLSIARVGQTVAISGMHATNDGSWEVVDSGANADGSTYLKVGRMSVNFSHVAFVSFASGTYTVAAFQVLDKYDRKAMSESPEFLVGSDGRMGTHDQPVDTLFEGLRGVGNQPAYRGRGVFRIRGLECTDSLNVLPNFSALIVEDPARTAGQALELICAEHGIAATDVDASAITDPLGSYQVRGAQDGRAKMQPLMLAYEVSSWEDGETIRFFKRKDAATIDVDSDHLSAHAEGDDAPRPISVSDADDESPQQVNVHYIDPDKSFGAGMQSARRQGIDNGITVNISLDVSMTPQAARDLALRFLWLADINARRIGFVAPPSAIFDLREGMVASFTAKGHDWQVFTTRVERASNYMLAVESVREQPHIFDAVAPIESAAVSTADLGQGTQRRSAAVLPLEFVFMDCAALSDEHTCTPGFYVACNVTSPNESFVGASLLESVDEDGEAWKTVAHLTQAATIGTALTELGTALPDEWDEANTLDVELTAGGTLETVAQLTCLNGANRAWFGGEIIGWRRATAIDGEVNQYRLSGLLRGLRGTANRIDGHEIGNQFVLLTGPGIHFQPLQLASVGMPRKYLVLSPGATVDADDATDFTPTGSTVLPFAPCNVVATRDGSNNVTLTWERVTRANVRLLSTQAVPMLEPSEGYEIDVYDGADVVRTITATSATASYSAANQTTDGLTPGDPLDIVIYQTSDLLRRGFAATATV